MDCNIIIVSQKLSHTHSQIEDQASVEVVIQPYHLGEQWDHISKHHYMAYSCFAVLSSLWSWLK